MRDIYLGNHMLVEYYDCDEELLEKVGFIEKIMVEAAEIANATIVESVFHQFNPWGVSGVVVIEESHLTIHTWPEYGYAAVDLFTCGVDLDAMKAFYYLKEKLESNRFTVNKINRGELSKINVKISFS